MMPAARATATATSTGPANALRRQQTRERDDGDRHQGLLPHLGHGDGDRPRGRPWRPTWRRAALARAFARFSAEGSGLASVTCGILPSPAGERWQHFKGDPLRRRPRQGLGSSHRAPVHQDRGHLQDSTQAGMRGRSRLQHVTDLVAGELLAVAPAAARADAQ
jgi:hypothetical protein